MNGNEYESASPNEDGSVMAENEIHAGLVAKVRRAEFHVGCSAPVCDTSGCPGEALVNRAAAAGQRSAAPYVGCGMRGCETAGCTGCVRTGVYAHGPQAAGSALQPSADTARIETLETALRELVARVERIGGYATWDDQCVLWRARQALVGGGA